MSMRISRRAFLCACGADALARSDPHGPVPLLLDLGPACLLPESLAGYRQALPFPHDSWLPAVQVAFIPGAGALPPGTASSLQSHMARGGNALLECALGLTNHRPRCPYFPYVDFTWPVHAKIREFFPLALDLAPGDRVIATYAGRPVALRRNAGRGTLILLGSPVGPALLAHDPDAHRWLLSVLRWLHTHSEG